jgi:hypothetical protein
MELLRRRRAGETINEEDLTSEEEEEQGALGPFVFGSKKDKVINPWEAQARTNNHWSRDSAARCCSIVSETIIAPEVVLFDHLGSLSIIDGCKRLNAALGVKNYGGEN